MKNILNYYYNLNIDAIKEYENYLIINSDNQIYIFKRLMMPLDDFKSILEIVGNLNNVHKIMVNKENNLVTIYNNNSYVLIMPVILNDTVSLNNIIYSLNNGTCKANLWEFKVDYYMHQIKELSLGKESLINSFNYYIGMAENAISLYNETNHNNFNYAIMHRRITIPNYAINYFDPTNMIIDVRVRDISEYIKYKFFNDSINIEELHDILKFNFNNDEMVLLFARLLFPTYYFDVFEDGIISSYEEKDIEKYVSKSEEYEEFLYDFYCYFKEFYQIPEIEWLKK